MRKISYLLLTTVTGLIFLSSINAQIFDIKAQKQKPKLRIGRVPDEIPVLSSTDFQSKVKSEAEQNRKDMTSSGASEIQGQLSELPSNKPNDPPPLPEKSADKNIDGTKPDQLNSQSTTQTQQQNTYPPADQAAPPQQNYSTGNVIDKSLPTSKPKASSNPSASDSGNGQLSIKY